jgi:transposase
VEVFMGQRAFRKRHTPAFKVEAVRVMHERIASGLTLQRVSEELEVGPDLLRTWAKQVAGAPPGTSPEEIFPGAGQRRRFGSAPKGDPPPDEALSLAEEVRQLRRENDRLRQERDFLKKAAAFFAKESR